jgi:hypothetical protein
MKGNERAGKSTNGAAGTTEPDGPMETSAPAEATIDQVRDLLFGGAQRSLQGSLVALREEMQASLAQVRQDFAKELAAVQAKVRELEQDTEQKRLSSLKDVGAAISQLGAAVSGLGSGRTGS